MLFFSRTDKILKERFEKEQKELMKKKKIDFLLRFLDTYEVNVIKILKDNEGISQSALRWKVDMSKSKLSYVLGDLEKRGIIKRVQRGKTLSVYLKI